MSREIVEITIDGYALFSLENNPNYFPIHAYPLDVRIKDKECGCINRTPGLVFDPVVRILLDHVNHKPQWRATEWRATEELYEEIGEVILKWEKDIFEKDTRDKP